MASIEFPQDFNRAASSEFVKSGRISGFFCQNEQLITYAIDKATSDDAPQPELSHFANRY